MLETLEYLRHEGMNWDWVWLDSISLFQDVGLDDVYTGVLDTKNSPEERRKRAQFGPDRGEYRVNMWRLEQFIRHAVGADLFNFGVTAHPFWMTIQSGETPEEAYEQLMPWIQGKAMPTKICGYMNVVSFMEVARVKVGRDGDKKDRRVLHFNKTSRWYAKDQFSTFSDGRFVAETPDIVDIISRFDEQRPTQRRTGRTRRTTGRRERAR